MVPEWLLLTGWSWLPSVLTNGSHRTLRHLPHTHLLVMSLMSEFSIKSSSKCHCKSEISLCIVCNNEFLVV